MISLDKRNIEYYKIFIENLIAFTNNYTWITDAYVSDFFFKQHWQNLPNSWQSALPCLSTTELSFLLDRKHAPLRQVLPLSLLSFKTCCDTYSLDRGCCGDIEDQVQSLFKKGKYCDDTDTGQAADIVPESEDDTDTGQTADIVPESEDDTDTGQTADIVPKREDKKQLIPLESEGRLHAYFRKHVKPKKQHEIKNLSKVIYLLCQWIDCDNVVDVGSGLGHLARVLSFGYGLNVTSVEAANSHAPKAQKYDREIDREIKKRKMKQTCEEVCVSNETSSMPSHVTSMIYPNMSTHEFISIVKSQQYTEHSCIVSDVQKTSVNLNSIQSTSADNVSYDLVRTDWKFVLTGLHACGDLTPTLLRFYTNCENCSGLASVGCCYMKMSDKSSGYETFGYPMSEFVSSLPGHSQSYAARELACHFAETYSARLKECSPHLKIHSFRAALEWLANMLSPSFQRAAVQIPCRKSLNMQFERYARLGLSKLGISDDELTDSLLHEASQMTDKWKDVVAFYTIRLALAPVIETLMLLDRMIFLFEKGHTSSLVPVFDPQLSPRNFALLSWKNDKSR